MTAIDIRDLPTPPPDKTGWPWTQQSPPLPALDDGAIWPRITIVTPSYNQGHFIEEAIRSVLLQGYPNLQYIVMDGGSKDATVEVIRRYERWIPHWVSQRDKGQSDAINRGLDMADDVCGWLCSDDLLSPGALGIVGRHFARNPQCRWLSGRGDFLSMATGAIEAHPAGIESPAALLEYWQYGFEGHFLPQPSTFWRKSLWQEVGGLQVENHLAMDYELWLAFQEHASLDTVDEALSISRIHEDCKSASHAAGQYVETMRCAYHAAERRGLGSAWLSWRLLRWIFRWRLAQCREHVKRHRWQAGVCQVSLLLAAMFGVWSENGRLTALGKR